MKKSVKLIKKNSALDSTIQLPTRSLKGFLGAFCINHISNSSQDIPLDRNEKVYVIGNIEKFWVQVKKVKTGEIGFVPSQILDWIVNISLKFI